MTEAHSGGSWSGPVTVAIRTIILFIAVLTVPLTIAQELGLSDAETASWLFSFYGVTGVISLLLALAFRQPLLTTGNLFALLFISSLGQQFSYPEIVGAFIVAGGGVLVVSALGLTRRLARWLPAPIVFGLLAGAILPFVMRIFSSLNEAPFLVAGTFVAYLLGRRFLQGFLPALFPALVAALLLTALTGQFGEIPDGLAMPLPQIIIPVFSLPAIISVSPILVVLFTLQANLPSLVFMREQGYTPPERVVDLVSGAGTIAGSFLGPMGVSLSLPITSLVAGPEAGPPAGRHRTVFLAAGGALVIGLLAGFAAELPEIIPRPLLVTLAGLAFVSVLANALRAVTAGPLQLGPLFAFVIAVPEFTFLGFGSFFWALVAGSAISMLLEPEELAAVRAAAEGKRGA